MTNGSKVAIVTGGASGIGAAVVAKLLSTGHAVAAVDLSAEALASAWGQESRVLRLAADVTDRAAVSAAVESVVERLGAPAVLVNCAGIYRASNLLDTTDEDFDAVVRVNLTGTFLPSQLVARAMVAAGVAGAIVNITSVAASEATEENGAYAASKGGVTALTRALAVSFAEHGIRVNAVQPGPIATPQGLSAVADPVYAERMVGRMLMKRLADPAEIAAAVAFLASEEAGFITGSILTADGGVLAHR
jgi:NAD(P)-dependent dehydrogenase (short-subunit alcohol dehydrogenase family)